MIRLLIKDITVEKILNPKKLILHIRWQGGAVEDIHCDLPRRIQDRIRYPEKFVNRIRELARDRTNAQIATVLNQEGLKSSTGKPFTPSMISWMRFKHGIPSPRLKRPAELTVKEVAQQLDVSTGVVYYWIRNGYLEARRIQDGYPFWITLTAEKEKELRDRIKASYRLKKRVAQHS